MIPVRIKNATHAFVAPDNYDEAKHGPCVSLALRVEDGAKFISAWEPTPDELAELIAGGKIHLTVLGGQPPVMLSVEPYEPKPSGR